MERELNLRYYKDFKAFWVPILKKQVFKVQVANNTNALLEIKENIFKNWNLTKTQKDLIYELIGLYKIDRIE